MTRHGKKDEKRSHFTSALFLQLGEERADGTSLLVWSDRGTVSYMSQMGIFCCLVFLLCLQGNKNCWLRVFFSDSWDCYF